MTTLAEVVFEGDGVAGVAFIGGIGEVAKEGDEADDKIEGDVEEHFCAHGGWEGGFGGGAEDHEREKEVKDIANAVGPHVSF